MSTIACARCGSEVDDAFAYYDEEGQICPDCHDQGDLRATFRMGYQRYAWAAMGTAGLSFLFNPCFLVTGVAIGSAISALTYRSRLDPEDREAVADMGWVNAVALLAILVALASPILNVALRVLANSPY